MTAIKIETVIQENGQLHLTGIPCRRGDKVEVILLVEAHQTATDEREKAFQRFVDRAKASRFRSTGRYPSREELYDRS